MSMPFAIGRHLRRMVSTRLHPGLLQLDTGYRIAGWRGELDYFGIGPLERGTDARELLPALYGLVPGEDNGLLFVEAPNGRSMDLSLLSETGGYLLLITDSTDERDRRQEMQQQANEIALLNGRLNKLMAALEQANRVKGRFIAAMSHEFRTPLAAIKGQVELRREQSPEHPGDLDVIDANATHLLSLIDNVLDQAKIESGQLELAPLPTDLRELLRDIRTMFEPIAGRKGIELDTDLAADCPPLLQLDAPRLRQVLVNLLGNAFKFTREGKVSLRLKWYGERLRGAVRDTGPGIPEQAQRRIFQAFQQEQSAAADHPEGAGLGLAISSQLVSLMGGSLRVKSQPGQGAEFSFGIEAPVSERFVEQDPAGIRVLVADDSDDLRLLLQHQLNKEGFRVQAAENAGQVLEAVAERSPDVLLLDLYLGNENGSELARRLRDEGYFGGILILSAASGREERSKALEAGCDDYMVKPVPVQQLRRRLMELADRGKVSRYLGD